nr:MAG TPA: hypothetical protein [Caudoviricetes sp.]
MKSKANDRKTMKTHQNTQQIIVTLHKYTVCQYFYTCIM